MPVSPAVFPEIPNAGPAAFSGNNVLAYPASNPLSGPGERGFPEFRHGVVY